MKKRVAIRDSYSPCSFTGEKVGKVVTLMAPGAMSELSGGEVAVAAVVVAAMIVTRVTRCSQKNDNNQNSSISMSRSFHGVFMDLDRFGAGIKKIAAGFCSSYIFWSDFASTSASSSGMEMFGFSHSQVFFRPSSSPPSVG